MDSDNENAEELDEDELIEFLTGCIASVTHDTKSLVEAIAIGVRPITAFSRRDYYHYVPPVCVSTETKETLSIRKTYANLVNTYVKLWTELEVSYPWQEDVPFDQVITSEDALTMEKEVRMAELIVSELIKSEENIDYFIDQLTTTISCKGYISDFFLYVDDVRKLLPNPLPPALVFGPMAPTEEMRRIMHAQIKRANLIESIKAKFAQYNVLRIEGPILVTRKRKMVPEKPSKNVTQTVDSIIKNVETPNTVAPTNTRISERRRVAKYKADAEAHRTRLEAALENLTRDIDPWIDRLIKIIELDGGSLPEAVEITEWKRYIPKSDSPVSSRAINSLWFACLDKISAYGSLCGEIDAGSVLHKTWCDEADAKYGDSWRTRTNKYGVTNNEAMSKSTDDSISQKMATTCNVNNEHIVILPSTTSTIVGKGNLSQVTSTVRDDGQGDPLKCVLTKDTSEHVESHQSDAECFVSAPAYASKPTMKSTIKDSQTTSTHVSFFEASEVSACIDSNIMRQPGVTIATPVCHDLVHTTFDTPQELYSLTVRDMNSQLNSPEPQKSTACQYRHMYEFLPMDNYAKSDGCQEVWLTAKYTAQKHNAYTRENRVTRNTHRPRPERKPIINCHKIGSGLTYSGLPAVADEISKIMTTMNHSQGLSPPNLQCALDTSQHHHALSIGSYHSETSPTRVLAHRKV